MMMSKKRILLAIVAAALVFGTSFGAALAIEWNHDPLSDIGPYQWGALLDQNGALAFPICGTGRQQSPVAIAGSVLAAAPPLQPLFLDYGETPLEVENNGHVIEVPIEGGTSSLMIGSDVYELVQFHFHAPSEHALNGGLFDMEAHLVHRSPSGRLAVVGVWMKVGPDPNPLVDLIFQNAPEEEGSVTVPHTHIRAMDLLPLPGNAVVPPAIQAQFILNDYYAYSGSLTTPPCTEGVRWLVLKDTVPVSPFAVDRFHEIISRFPAYRPPINFRVYPDDNRPVQPLNERVIFERFGR